MALYVIHNNKRSLKSNKKSDTVADLCSKHSSNHSGVPDKLQ